MSFQRPALSDLVTRIEADFKSRLEVDGVILRRAVVFVLSRVIAGATHMLYGALAFLARQLFPDKSEAEFLVRQGGLFGLGENPPGFAKGTLTATGTNGTVIPATTVLQRSDGAEYTVDADVTVAMGTATLSVTAVVANADGTMTVADVFSFESPIAGVDSTAVVASSTQSGSDAETPDEYRVRVLARMAEPPHGGNAPDLVEIAKEVSGVTRAWITPFGLGPGTVIVRFVRDDDVGSIIPDSGEVAAVQAQLDAEAPAHMTATAVAPVAAPVDFTLAVVPNTQAVKDAVAAELEDLFQATSPAATILLSTMRTAIGNGAGLTTYTLATPSGDVTHTANQLPTLGTVTFT